MRSRNKLVLVVLLTVGFGCSDLLAQEQPEVQSTETPNSQTGYGDPVLEEIIVTAQKRDEYIQDVPIAISVLTARDLQVQQIYDATQLQYSIPSLQQQSVNNQVGATNFFIRGVGTAIYGPAVESAVATVIDDVALARPAMGVVQFFDLERVEVLRGPQGMLFGKNASAGLVHIVTARPRLGEVEALAHLSYGGTNSGTDGDEIIGQVAVNAPVSENSAARVSAFYTQQDGFMKNVFMNEDLGLEEFGVRVKYLWQPSDDLEVFASADYAHEEGPGGTVLARRYDAPGGFIELMDTLAGIVASPENVDIASNAPTDNHFEVGGAQVNVLYDLDSGHTLTNIAAYRSYRDRSALDTDTLPISFFDGNDQRRKQHQFSNEFRLTSPTGSNLDYQVGLYYLKVRDEGGLTQTANLEPFFPPPPPGFLGNFGGTGSSTIYNENYAAFGQARYSLNDTVRLIAGGRLTHDDVDGVAVASGEGYVIPSQATGTLSAGLTESNFSYRFGAEWDITPDSMGYVTYARGYKSPTFGGATGTEAIRAEIPKNIEVGLKSSLFANKLSVNLALYHVSFQDYQAQAYDPQALRFTTTNAGEVRSQGVEMDFRARPHEFLSLGGGFAYNDAVYKSFYELPCYFGQPAGSSGTNVCLPSGTTDVTGNQLAYAPEWTAFVMGEFSRPLTSGYDGFITASYYYRSSVYFTAAHDPKTYLGGFGMVGGSLGAQTSDGRVRVSIFVRNLFDERVPTFIVADILSPFYGDDARGGNYWHQFGESSFRTVGIALDWRY
jgi:iron complex outermembrane receptor protein